MIGSIEIDEHAVWKTVQITRRKLSLQKPQNIKSTEYYKNNYDRKAKRAIPVTGGR